MSNREQILLLGEKLFILGRERTTTDKEGKHYMTCIHFLSRIDAILSDEDLNADLYGGAGAFCRFHNKCFNRYIKCKEV